MTCITESSLLNRRLNQRKDKTTIAPIGTPITTAPKLIRKKTANPSATVKSLPKPKIFNEEYHFWLKTVKNTIALPSLSRDSPAIMTLRRGGAPHSLSKELTATGSVALRIDPHARHSQKFQLYGSM